MLLPQTETSAVTSLAKWLFAVCLLPVYNIYKGAEWLLLAVIVCVIADYRFGRGESRKRYEKAKADGDQAAMLHWQWRKSRAWRRTLTKTGDYFLIVTLGVFIGHAFLPLLGVAHWWASLVATAVCCLCEVVSIAGHFCYLKGVDFDPQDLRHTLTRFLIALARRKMPDIGGALGDALEERGGEAQHGKTLQSNQSFLSKESKETNEPEESDKTGKPLQPNQQ